MDQATVQRLEEEIENALAALFSKAALKSIPLRPDANLLHLMAKAAVTVYETATEYDTR